MTAHEDVKTADLFFGLSAFGKGRKGLRRAKRRTPGDIIRPEFDADFYRAAYPSLASASLENLISDYCNGGWCCGRDPTPEFSTRHYLEQNEDVRTAGINPFAHWIEFGRKEGREAAPSDVALPKPENQEEDEAAALAAAAQHIRGEFDSTFYKEAYPQIAAEGHEDLAVEYCTNGWMEGRDPSPDFSTSRYLHYNPDVREARVNPFLHWICFGRAEGRRSDPSIGFANHDETANLSLPPIFSRLEGWRWQHDDHEALWQDLAPDFPYGIAPGPISAALVLFMAQGGSVPAARIRDALIFASGPVTVLLPGGSERPALDESASSRVHFVDVDGAATSADLRRALKGLSGHSVGIWDCSIMPAVSAWRLLEHSLELDPECDWAGPTLFGPNGMAWRSGTGLDPASVSDGRADIVFRDVGTFCLDPIIFRQRPASAADPAMSLFRLETLRERLRDTVSDMPLEDAVMAASATLKGVTQGCALARSVIPPIRPAQLPQVADNIQTQVPPLSERIVFVDSVPPQPDQDAGSVTAWNFLEIFRERRSEVLFYSTGQRDWDNRYALAMAARGIVCMTSHRVADYDAACDLISRTTPAEPHALNFILTRVHAGGEVLERTRALFPTASVIFNTVDLHGLRELREAKLSGSLAREFLAQSTITRESQIIQMSDATILLSEVELAETRETMGYANLKLIPMINELSPPKAGFSDRDGILFVGSFAHFPNRDAVLHLIENLWEPMRAEIPNLTIKLIGSHFPSDIAKLLPEGVIATGYVEDLAAELERARLTIAPLRYGAGIKGKIGTSLGHGVPCVATPLAAEGMGLKHGKEILIADTPEDFARATATCISFRSLRSSALSGSSSNRIRGRGASARASATRCC